MVPKRSILDWMLEAVALVGLIAAITALTVRWGDIPARVPRHFGSSGLPDGWGEKTGLWFIPITALVLYIALTAVSRYPRLINIPMALDREAPETKRLLLGLSIAMKTIMMLVFAYIEWASVQTALGRSQGLGRQFLPIVITLTSVPLVFYLRQFQRHRRP